MRIAIDAQLLGRPGGVGGYVASLLGALAQHDAEHTYVVYTHAKAPVPDLPPERFGIVRTPLTRRRPWRILWQRYRLPRRLETDGADVLHAPSYVAPLRGAVPVVLTLHDVIALKHPELCSRLNALHYRRHLPKAVEAAAVIVASSETTRRDIIDLLDVAPERIRVIYPSIDMRPPADPEPVRARLNLPERYLLFVGNIEPKKDLPTLLAAHDRLSRPRPALVIAGAGDPLPKPAGDVRFLGPVGAGDLPSLYACAEAFVFPSRYEGFGLPPLEAMACGTPVVCSEGGSLPEVVGDAALTFPVGDADALCDRLRLVLQDDARRAALTEAGRARAARFRWPDAVARLTRAYAHAAGVAGAGSI